MGALYPARPSAAADMLRGVRGASQVPRAGSGAASPVSATPGQVSWDPPGWPPGGYTFALSWGARLNGGPVVPVSAGVTVTVFRVEIADADGTAPAAREIVCVGRSASFLAKVTPADFPGDFAWETGDALRLSIPGATDAQTVEVKGEKADDAVPKVPLIVEFTPACSGTPATASHTLTIADVEIRAGDGQSPPPEFIGAGQTMDFEAASLPDGIGGAYAWSTGSAEMQIAPSGSTVTVAAAEHPGSTGPHAFAVVFTPNGGSCSRSADHEVTIVVADLDVDSDNNEDYVLQGRSEAEDALESDALLPMSQADEQWLLKFPSSGVYTLYLGIETPGGGRLVGDSVRVTVRDPSALYWYGSMRGEQNQVFAGGYPVDGGGVVPMADKFPDVHQPQGCVDNRHADPDKRYLLVLHGFNVTAGEAAEWHDEVFKRVYWTGYRDNYIGLTWFGDEGLPVFPVQEYLFDHDVGNALHTSPSLYNSLKDTVLGASGWNVPVSRVNLMAHSLGNLVAWDALRINQWRSPGTQIVNNILGVQSAV